MSLPAKPTDDVGRSASRTAALTSKIGRNLLLYQEIELRLKVLVPFISSTASPSTLDALELFQRRIRKERLGNLTSYFAKSVTFNSDVFARELEHEARNRLVHRFLEVPEFRASARHGYQAALDYLDTKFRAARNVHRVVEALSTALIAALEHWGIGLTRVS